MKPLARIFLVCLLTVSVIAVAGADAGAEARDSSMPRVTETATEQQADGEERDLGVMETPQISEPLVEVDVLRIAPGLIQDEAEEEEAVNEMAFQRFILRGAAVQWFKTDNLLQLFNPFAPARYGSGEQNLAYDVITGRPKGITVLSIDFGGRTDRRAAFAPVALPAR
jgi:hypothetical protein